MKIYKTRERAYLFAEQKLKVKGALNGRSTTFISMNKDVHVVWSINQDG
jgi:hypothetical protein